MEMEVKGIYPIMAPPFTNEGEIDWHEFHQLIRHLVKTGIDGLTMFGLASEFHKLNDFEREDLAKAFVNELKGTGVHSVLSVTDHCTELAVKRAKQYEQLGADALMILPPFFLNPSINAIREHLQAVLQTVSIPVFVQYAPTETKVEISTSELADLGRRFPNVVYKIESNPPMECIRGVLAQQPAAVIMNGYAGLYMIDVLNAGGKGVMPGCSYAEIYVEIYRLYQEGMIDESKQLHQKLLNYISKWMTSVEYLIKVEKTILQLRGLISTNYCRKPSYPLNRDEMWFIHDFLSEFQAYLNIERI
jgi:2-keto-3-deoxy-L-arabinonate dehydratase